MNSFNPLVGINESKSSSDLTNLNRVTESSEVNYFGEMVDFLIQLNEDHINLNKRFYKSLLESEGDVIFVQESYGDFFDGFKKIIDKFLAFIKNIFDRFVTKINSFIQNEKYLLKNKKVFDRFTTSDEYETDGYNYTFDSNIPIIDLPIKFDSALLGDVNKISLNAIDNPRVTIDPAKVAVDKLHSGLKKKLENGYYDTFRASVIGDVGGITEDAFSTACFKTYRNGAEKPDNVYVSKAYIDSALERIAEYKKSIKDIQETKNRIYQEYNDIRAKIDQMVKPNSTEISGKLRAIELMGIDGDSSITTVSYETMTSLDKYLKTISNQVQEMSNIHGIAFASKMDAVKEQYRQDKRILYDVLSDMHTTTKAINDIKESYDDSNDTIEEGGSLWIF